MKDQKFKGNILVVDDDPDVREIFAESLIDNGYHAEVASRGDEALRKYRFLAPDLVVLDIMLPDMDGFTICNKIRESDIYSETPVIIISADGVPESMLKGYQSGAQDYIKKPFSLKEVLAKINNLIANAHGRKGLRRRNLLLEDELQREQTDYKLLSRKLKKKVLDMKTLFQLSQDLNRLQDSEDLVNVFSLTLMGQFGVGSVAVFYRANESDDYLSFAGGRGVKENLLRTLRICGNSGLSKVLMSEEEILKLDDKGLPEEGLEEASFLAEMGFKSIYPLVVKSKLLGVVLIGSKINEKDYSESDLDLFRSICASAATGLENARLYAELQSTYLSTIKILVSTIEAKDSYTRGHTERVAKYAVMLADVLGLSKKERETVNFGAVLHDIGKLGVYETILNKPGELTDDEWSIVQSHPEMGANIIKDMKFLRSACDLVRHHHERLDGDGYPDGLRGEEISLGARIVAIADSFDAMTSDRPYRKAYTVKEAMKKLKQQNDKFDQNIVEKLEELVKGERIKLGNP